MLRRVAQGQSEVTNAEPGQGALHAVHKPRAFLDQALALPIGPLGVLFGNRRHARHAAVAPFATQPSQEPALQQLGVEPIGLCPAMFPRHGHTRGMDHVRLDPTRLQPARQPEAVAAGFEATAIRVIVRPALTDSSRQRCSRASSRSGFGSSFFARLTLNAGEDAANQPARLAHLDDGNDRAILVQRHQGPAQIVRLGHRGTPSIDVSDEIATLAARPIASLRWREPDSNFWYRGTKNRGFSAPFRAFRGIGGRLNSTTWWFSPSSSAPRTTPPSRAGAWFDALGAPRPVVEAAPTTPYPGPYGLCAWIRSGPT